LFGESGNDSLYGLKGHDQLDGGSGRDILDGGLGHDLLLGGAGNDKLIGQTGRDILIGGAGSDFLHGGKDDDILIGGTTDHDNNAAAVLAIMVEWISNAPAATRISHLSGLQSGGANGTLLLSPGGTVHADGSIDQLYGYLGNDWFLQSISDADAVRDRNPRQDRLHRF
jgi:Ca2+-binding RTX toxin-like protein